MKKLLLNREQCKYIQEKLKSKKLKITERQLEKMVNYENKNISFDEFIEGIKMLIGTKSIVGDSFNNSLKSINTSKNKLIAKLITLGIADMGDGEHTIVIKNKGVKDKLLSLYNHLVEDNKMDFKSQEVELGLNEYEGNEFEIKRYKKNGMYLPKPFETSYLNSEEEFSILTNHNNDSVVIDHSKLNKNELVKYSDGELDYVDGDFKHDVNDVFTNKTIESWFNDNYEDIEIGVGIDSYKNDNLCCIYIDDEVLDMMVDITKDENLNHFYKREAEIDETTTASSAGHYVQPGIWAKDKKNHVFSQSPGIPNGKIAESDAFSDGKIVKFDDCTKLNNNKVAQKGGCSQGAVDNVVKLVDKK